MVTGWLLLTGTYPSNVPISYVGQLSNTTYISTKNAKPDPDCSNAALKL